MCAILRRESISGRRTLTTKSLLSAAQSRALRDELEKIHAVIEGAYADTRREVNARGYDSRIVQTHFGQALYANVNQGILEMKPTCPNLNIDLLPNRTKTAYHVVIKASSMRLTVSAVSSETDNPRYAHYREAYAHQLEFGFNANGEIQLVPVSYNHDYFELLHMAGGNRQSFGRVVVGVPDSNGGYTTGHMSWKSFLDIMFGPKSYPAGQAQIEVIDDPFESLEVRATVEPEEV